MDLEIDETDGFKNSCRNVIKYMNNNNIDLIPGFETNYKNYQMIKSSCLDFFSLNNDTFKNKNNIFTSQCFEKNIFYY